MIDDDINNMTREELIEEIKKLRAGIRNHRDNKGHNLCWFVPELWGLLPDKIEPSPEVPPFQEFIECCMKYRKSLDK